MFNLKVLGVAAILSSAIVSPVLAQQAWDAEEPGNYAFFHPNAGLGGPSSRPAEAMASVRTGRLYAAMPARHYAHKSTKHYARVQGSLVR
jgi:hypothetical protein